MTVFNVLETDEYVMVTWVREGLSQYIYVDGELKDEAIAPEEILVYSEEPYFIGGNFFRKCNEFKTQS